GGNEVALRTLKDQGAADFSYAIPNCARFRVNVFKQRGTFAIVMRVIANKIPSLAELKLPTRLAEIAALKNGIVLVTGPTGSGKSSTLAAIIDLINESRAEHILTIEDPIEFLHQHKKGTIHQRELHSDTPTFALALRAALRQAPKVILVGEMRDRETVEIALSAAETGHLVFSTLHTIDSGQTINRILGLFEPDEQEQVRYRLADTLRWVISQRLVPKIGGGRHPLVEVMGSNLRTKESILLRDSEGKSFYEIIEASQTFGWRTFDHSCLEAYKRGIITEEAAVLFASKRGHVTRG